MADKRMIAKTIITSDAFLDMPFSAQMLYIQLNMVADDDGFINNPKSTARQVNCIIDDFELLSKKKFIICFQSGVCVIKHWKMSNKIQKDRYKETNYKKEKTQLEIDENGAYTLTKESMDTECIQNVSKMYSQVRLGKDRLGKVNIPLVKTDELFLEFWSEYPKKIGKGAAEKIWKKIKPNKELTDKMIKAIQKVKYSPQWTKDGGQFIPNPTTWLNQKRWEDDIDDPNKDPDKNYDKEFAEWTL